METLTKAVQENPNDADAHTMLGYSYRKLGVFDRSIEHYQKALKIDSCHRSAHEYLGELYLEMNQPANAEKQLEALKKACPFFGSLEPIRDCGSVSLIAPFELRSRGHFSEYHDVGEV